VTFFGVLLSGGLDSSVTSAIAKKYAQNVLSQAMLLMLGIPQLHSFQ
jgi:asparagine synthase (glutamine-hydrolysing)